MRGTNPGRWNSWKGALLDHLHSRTAEALERGLDQPQHQDDLIAERQAEARIKLMKRGYDNHNLNLLFPFKEPQRRVRRRDRPYLQIRATLG